MNQMIVFRIGKFYGSHHLRDSTSFCEWCIFFHQPPRKHKTSWRNDENHPKMPIQNLVKRMFPKCENLSVQNCNDSCNDGTNPERNGLQNVFLQFFIMDIIKRFFEDGSGVSE